MLYSKFEVDLFDEYRSKQYILKGNFYLDLFTVSTCTPEYTVINFVRMSIKMVLKA